VAQEQGTVSGTETKKCKLRVGALELFAVSLTGVAE